MGKVILSTKTNKKYDIKNNKTKHKGKKSSAVSNLKKNYTRFSYTNETLKEAIEKVRSNTLSANKAAAVYKIPKGTLIKKLHEDTPEPRLRKMGPPTILTEAEEERIKNWILDKARIGFPMHHTTVKKAIKSVLDQAPRPNTFKNNMPGNKWLKLFLKRHPEISLKNTEVLSKSRAAVTEENIRDWFAGLKNHLIAEGASDILDDPSRINNMDETPVQLCPKTGKLLGETSEKNNYVISPGQEKQNITVLCSYRADGKVIRPMIVFPYKRFPPKDVAASVPDGYVIGHTPNGWMTTDTFNTYIKNGFYKQLVEDGVKFPVLLLLDGHSSHISLEIHDFCKDHSIILYCLYPNATHILQPCDVGIFRPLKRCWQKKVAEQSQVSTAAITKANFAPLFHEAFIEASDPIIIKKSFECCGLYPFNPDKVNYTKCISYRHKVIKEKPLQQQEKQQLLDVDVHNHKENVYKDVVLQNIESHIPPNILSQFELAYQEKKLPSVELVLYNMWKKFRDISQDKIIESCDETDPQSQIVYQKNDFFYAQDLPLKSDHGTNLDVTDMHANNALSLNLHEENQELMVESNSRSLNECFDENNSIVLTINDDELNELLLQTNNPVLIDDKNVMDTSTEALNHDVISPIKIEENTCKVSNIDEIWKKELHYPEISDVRKRKKNLKPKIFAITSEEWRKQEEEKKEKEMNQNRLKEFNKIKREMAKKIKQEEIEIKKQKKEAHKELKLKEKAELEIKKKEREEEMKLLLKRTAQSLNLENYDVNLNTKKKKIGNAKPVEEKDLHE